VAKLSLASGAHAAVVANHWAEGGKGAVDLGAAVAEACAAAKAVSVCVRIELWGVECDVLCCGVVGCCVWNVMKQLYDPCSILSETIGTSLRFESRYSLLTLSKRCRNSLNMLLSKLS
jgi:hypothetical protein